MNEDDPIDLSPLVADEPSDQVRPAIRRFRIRVVLLTLLCLAVVTAAVGYALAYRQERRHAAETAIEIQAYPQFSTNINYSNCSTPAIPFKDADVRLVAIGDHMVLPPGSPPVEPVDLKKDGWAVQIWFEPHENGPVIIDPTDENRRLHLAGPEVEEAFTAGTPGWSVAPMFAVVREAPDGLIHMDVIDTDRKVIGKITLDPKTLTGTTNC